MSQRNWPKCLSETGRNVSAKLAEMSQRNWPKCLSETDRNVLAKKNRNRPGKKQIPGFDLPPIVVTKIKFKKRVPPVFRKKQRLRKDLNCYWM